MKEHKRNATGHSQWNCSFSCGTAGNNYKWVVQPTSAGSALLPDFKALPCAALGHSSLRPRCFACAATSRGELPWLRGKKVGGGRGKRLWVQAGGAGRSRGGFCLPGQSGCNLEHAVRSAFPVSSASLLHEGLCKGEKGAGLGLGCWKGFWSCQQLCVLGVGALLGLHHALCLLSPQTCSCSRGGPAAGQRGLVRSSAFICWSCRGVARPGDCEAFPQGCQHQPLASWHISVAGDTQLRGPRRLRIRGDPARALLCILPTSLPLPRLFSSLQFSPEPLHLYPEWLESSSSSKAAGHSF